MYNNIGSKIKWLASTIFIIEAIGAAISGFALVFLNENMIPIGLLVIVVGPIFAWISSWLLYGFGELIDKVCDIESNMRKTPSKAITDMIIRQGNGYICPKCHLSNDSMEPCERCGYTPY